MQRTPRIELTNRDRLLLRQAYDDLLTVEAAHRHYFADQGVGAVHSTLRRLYGKSTKHGLLHPYPLDERRKYYRLTRRGARLLGVSKHHARPLNQQGKVQRYALSWLMHIDQAGRRTHFSPKDHPDKFHLLESRFPRHGFFIEEDGQAVRLGCAVVDCSGTPQNTARKTVYTIERFLTHGWFDVYIKARVFTIHLLTFEEERRRSLQRLLKRIIGDRLKTPLAALGENVRIDVRVRNVPDMDQLFVSSKSTSNTQIKESSHGDQ